MLLGGDVVEASTSETTILRTNLLGSHRDAVLKSAMPGSGFPQALWMLRIRLPPVSQSEKYALGGTDYPEGSGAVVSMVSMTLPTLDHRCLTCREVGVA
jgi:hypothetical protein